jgi:hypothetical protein
MLYKGFGQSDAGDYFNQLKQVVLRGIIFFVLFILARKEIEYPHNNFYGKLINNTVVKSFSCFYICIPKNFGC